MGGLLAVPESTATAGGFGARSSLAPLYYRSCTNQCKHMDVWYDLALSLAGTRYGLLVVWAYCCGSLLLARLWEGLPFAWLRCEQTAVAADACSGSSMAASVLLGKASVYKQWSSWRIVDG